MATQNRAIRLNCKGDMRTLVKAMNTDAAMMVWLDTVQNHKDVPNENYGRELQELFTLGVDDLAGNPNYTQADVAQIARAFTGWTVDPGNGKVSFDDADHDTSRSFPLGRRHEAGLRVDRRVRPRRRASTSPRARARSTRSSTSSSGIATPTCGTPSRAGPRGGCWSTSVTAAGPLRTPGMIQTMDAEIIAPSGFDPTFDDRGRCSAPSSCTMCSTPRWSRPVGGDVKSMKWPIDFASRTLRLIGVKLKGKYLLVMGGGFAPIADHLSAWAGPARSAERVRLGLGARWISSATLLARYRFARDVTGSRWRRPLQARAALDLGLTRPGDVVDAVPASSVSQTSSSPGSSAHRLSTAAAADDRPPRPHLRYKKLHGLFALVIESPRIRSTRRGGRTHGDHATTVPPARGLATAGMVLGPGLFGSRRRARAMACTIGDRYLIVFFLDGGNDGLNTIVPCRTARCAPPTRMPADGGRWDQPLAGRSRAHHARQRPRERHAARAPSGLPRRLEDALRCRRGRGRPGLRLSDQSLSHDESRRIWRTANPLGLAAYSGGLDRPPLRRPGYTGTDIPGVTIGSGVPGDFGASPTSVLAISALEEFNFPYDTD